MGGLSKKAHIIEKTLKENNKPALLVDAGALLFDRPKLIPGTEQQAQIMATGIVEAYNAMRYNAVAVSGHDLAAGLGFLLSLKEKSQFTWLSTNLVRKTTNQPIFTPTIIQKLGNYKVGITALTSPEEPGVLTQADNAIILSWEKVLPTTLKQLAASTDMIILLSSLPAYQNNEIARLHPEIHLIVQSEYRSANQHPLLENKTLICQTAKQGKYQGVLQFSWSKSKMWGEDKNAALTERIRQLDQINWQINSYKGRGEPEITYKDDPSRLDLYHSLQRQKEHLTKDISAMKAAMEQERTRGTAAGSFANDFFELDASLPDHPKVHAIIQQTKERINSIGRKQSQSQTIKPSSTGQAPKVADKKSAQSQFAGWQACVGCHAEKVTGWQGNSHAKAYMSLISSKQQFNLNCLTCHVTDNKTTDQQRMLNLADDLKNVGCEACHGPGRAHAANPTKSRVIAKPSTEVCQTCHTPERDNAFDYITKLSRISCTANTSPATAAIAN